MNTAPRERASSRCRHRGSWIEPPDVDVDKPVHVWLTTLRLPSPAFVERLTELAVPRRGSVSTFANPWRL